jgi:hypothetical protein
MDSIHFEGGELGELGRPALDLQNAANPFTGCSMRSIKTWSRRRGGVRIGMEVSQIEISTVYDTVIEMSRNRTWVNDREGSRDRTVCTWQNRLDWVWQDRQSVEDRPPSTASKCFSGNLFHPAA